MAAAIGKRRSRDLEQQQESTGTTSRAPGGGAAGRAVAEGGADTAGMRPRGRRPQAGPQGAEAGEGERSSAARGGEAARRVATWPQTGGGATRRGHLLAVEGAAGGAEREGQVGWGRMPGVKSRYTLTGVESHLLGFR